MSQDAIEQCPGLADPPLDFYGIPAPIWEHYYNKCKQGSLVSAEESVVKNFKGGYDPGENNKRSWGSMKSNLIDCLFDVVKPTIIHEYKRGEPPPSPNKIIDIIKGKTGVVLGLSTLAKKIKSWSTDPINPFPYRSRKDNGLAHISTPHQTTTNLEPPSLLPLDTPPAGSRSPHPSHKEPFTAVTHTAVSEQGHQSETTGEVIILTDSQFHQCPNLMVSGEGSFNDFLKDLESTEVTSGAANIQSTWDPTCAQLGLPLVPPTLPLRAPSGQFYPQYMHYHSHPKDHIANGNNYNWIKDLPEPLLDEQKSGTNEGAQHSDQIKQIEQPMRSPRSNTAEVEDLKQELKRLRQKLEEIQQENSVQEQIMKDEIAALQEENRRFKVARRVETMRQSRSDSAEESTTPVPKRRRAEPELPTTNARSNTLSYTQSLRWSPQSSNFNASSRNPPHSLQSSSSPDHEASGRAGQQNNPTSPYYSLVPSRRTNTTVSQPASTLWSRRDSVSSDGNSGDSESFEDDTPCLRGFTDSSDDLSRPLPQPPPFPPGGTDPVCALINQITQLHPNRAETSDE